MIRKQDPKGELQQGEEDFGCTPACDWSGLKSDKRSGKATMRTLSRLSLIAGIAVFAQLASAELTYNVIEAEVVFDTGEVSALDVDTNGGEIDFSAGDLPLIVGDGAWTSSGRNSATVTIVYTVESDTLITGLELIFSGWVTGYGALGYTEYVENWDPESGVAGPELGSVEGAYFGGALGGSDTPFTNSEFIEFNEGVFSYKVKKTFTLANFDNDPASSISSLSLVEQNAVPEPATMGALAVGALGLLARRRRK